MDFKVGLENTYDEYDVAYEKLGNVIADICKDHCLYKRKIVFR
jgi:hypothetical protein